MPPHQDHKPSLFTAPADGRAVFCFKGFNFHYLSHQLPDLFSFIFKGEVKKDASFFFLSKTNLWFVILHTFALEEVIVVAVVVVVIVVVLEEGVKNAPYIYNILRGCMFFFSTLQD